MPVFQESDPVVQKAADRVRTAEDLEDTVRRVLHGGADFGSSMEGARRTNVLSSRYKVDLRRKSVTSVHDVLGHLGAADQEWLRRAKAIHLCMRELPTPRTSANDGLLEAIRVLQVCQRTLGEHLDYVARCFVLLVAMRASFPHLERNVFGSMTLRETRVLSQCARRLAVGREPAETRDLLLGWLGSLGNDGQPVVYLLQEIRDLNEDTFGAGDELLFV